MNLKYRFSKHISTPIQRSIRTKLSLIIVIVAIIPLIVATVIFSTNSKEAMEKEILLQNSSKINLVKMTV